MLKKVYLDEDNTPVVTHITDPGIEFDILTVQAGKTDVPIMLSLVPENFGIISKFGGYEVEDLERRFEEAEALNQIVYFTFWKPRRF